VIGKRENKISPKGVASSHTTFCREEVRLPESIVLFLCQPGHTVNEADVLHIYR